MKFASFIFAFVFIFVLSLTYTQAQCNKCNNNASYDSCVCYSGRCMGIVWCQVVDCRTGWRPENNGSLFCSNKTCPNGPVFPDYFHAYYWTVINWGAGCSGPPCYGTIARYKGYYSDNFVDTCESQDICCVGSMETSCLYDETGH